MGVTGASFCNNSLSPRLFKVLFYLHALFYIKTFKMKPVVDKSFHGKIFKSKHKVYM